MPYIFDQDGKELGQVGIAPGESGGSPDNWSFGASLWEFLNPDKVQQEDAAIGANPRTYQEIWSDSFFGMASAAEEQRQAVVQESKNLLTGISPLIIGGVVIVAAIAVLTRR